MPNDADARPKDHSDNSTQAEGSQLRSIHGGLRGWPISSETKIRASPSTSCEQPKLPTPPPFELACVELRALAITPLEFPITPLRNHGRDGSTPAASSHRPNLASRLVRPNQVVC